MSASNRDELQPRSLGPDDLNIITYYLPRPCTSAAVTHTNDLRGLRTTPLLHENRRYKRYNTSVYTSRFLYITNAIYPSRRRHNRLSPAFFREATTTFHDQTHLYPTLHIAQPTHCPRHSPYHYKRWENPRLPRHGGVDHQRKARNSHPNPTT